MEEKNKLIEKETGNLYSNCFSRLNASDEHLTFQGELLAANSGLDKDKVEGKICLDGGCGHGTLSSQLIKLGAKEVYGVDLMPTPSESFREIKNLHFVQASLLDLPFSDNFFDLVVSMGVVHHTVDPQTVVSELTRVLRPGGKFVLGVYGKHGLFPYCLWLARLFAVKIKLIPKRFVEQIIELLKFSPMTRYQILDYLFVPVLRRFSPEQIKKDFFLKNQVENPVRIYGINPKEAKFYRDHQTVYTYDARTFLSKILFGYGFIVMAGEKDRF